MLLQETAEGLCQTPLFKYSPVDDQWQAQESLCTLAAYDRFISDRAFGQKKRVLHIPGTATELQPGYYRIGRSTGPVFMIESNNADLDAHGAYYHTYMLRQLRYPVKVMIRQAVEVNETGLSKRMLVPTTDNHWCDLEAQSSTRSDDMPVTFTQWQIVLPNFITLPADCVLRVNTEGVERFYRVAERIISLDANIYRVLEHHE